MKLAILIPTLDSRVDLFNRLTAELSRQMLEFDPGDNVCFIWYRDNGEMTTGAKRNKLIELAIERKAEYIAFHDDDDLPGPTYIKRGLEVANSGMDSGELWGNIYWSGKKGKPFHHFLECKEWWEDSEFYYRTINHLNFQKLDLVKDFKFPDQNFGEDGQWSMKVKEANVLKTMYPIPEVIYKYFVGEPKFEII